MRTNGVILLCALAAAVPIFLLSDYRLFQLTEAVVYAVAILGLSLVTGFNGQISLGTAHSTPSGRT